MSPQQPFKGAASGPVQKTNDLLLYWFYLTAIFDSQKFDTRAKFDAQVAELFGTDPLAQETQSQLDLFASLFLNHENPDRQRTFQENLTKYTGNLNIGPHDPSKSKFISELSTRLDNRLIPLSLSGSPHSWGLHEKVAFAMDAAKKQGLDPVMFVNQLWTESRFDNDATGPQTRYGRARGIGQFIQSTGGRYDLHTVADFNNPAKSIEAAARYMGDLTRRFGDQRIALIAYNAGEGTVTSFGKDATLEQIMGHWGKQNREHGETNDLSKARNQTFKYVMAIDSSLWTPSKLELADRAMSKIGYATADAAEDVIRKEGLTGTFAGKDRPKTNAPVLMADASLKTEQPAPTKQ